jgi:cobalamin biosynthesis protein CobD/CbiB
MKLKLINILLLVTSLLGYLEWGGNNHAFLFQSEYQIILKLFSSPKDAIHPFTIVPMLGQLLLIITLFQNKPSKTLTLLGIICLILLLGFIFIIGLFSLNFKITLSTIPFFIIIALITPFKRKNNKTN